MNISVPSAQFCCELKAVLILFPSREWYCSHHDNRKCSYWQEVRWAGLEPPSAYLSASFTVVRLGRVKASPALACSLLSSPAVCAYLHLAAPPQPQQGAPLSTIQHLVFCLLPQLPGTSSLVKRSRVWPSSLTTLLTLFNFLISKHPCMACLHRVTPSGN